MSGLDNLWTEDRLVPDADNAIGLSFSPAVAVFNNSIYVFHQGRGNDGQLAWSTFNGSSWSPDWRMPPGMYYGIKYSPAVAVYKDLLYVAYHDGNDQLRVGTLNAWGHWSNIETARKYEISISYSPAIAVFKDRLYIAYQGSGAYAGRLKYISSGDGQTFDFETAIPDVNVTGAPALVVYRDRLFLFHKGANESFDPTILEAVAKSVFRN